MVFFSHDFFNCLVILLVIFKSVVNAQFVWWFFTQLLFQSVWCGKPSVRMRHTRRIPCEIYSQLRMLKWDILDWNVKWKSWSVWSALFWKNLVSHTLKKLSQAFFLYWGKQRKTWSCLSMDWVSNTSVTYSQPHCHHLNTIDFSWHCRIQLFSQDRADGTLLFCESVSFQNIVPRIHISHYVT
jgi:hypothetical protein